MPLVGTYFCSSARDCSAAIGNDVAPTPGVSDGIMNDRGLLSWARKLFDEKKRFSCRSLF